jgi:hypothetical protein
MIYLPYNFEPRGYQRNVFAAIDAGYKRLIIVWHRRSGKGKTLLNVAIRECLRGQALTAYIIYPTYKQIKLAIWQGIDAEGHEYLWRHIPEDLIARRNEQEMSVQFVNGSRLFLIGSENADRLVGVNPKLVIMDEWSLQDPRIWALYRPILNENGGTAIFSGTPRGQEELFKTFQHAQNDPRWYSSLLTVDDTRRDAPGESGGAVISQEDIDQDISEGMPKSMADQEYRCSFNGIRDGSFYGEQMIQMRNDARITEVPWKEGVPVSTVWDLGIADACAVIFFQSDGDYINIIDVIEETGASLASIIAQVRGRRYTYGTHYAPHDIKQRELTSGKSRLEISRDLGIAFRVVENLPLMDGINALRTIFGRMRIDRTKGGRLIQSLTGYHRDYDDKRRTYSDKPVHDWSSHLSDAARYLAIVADKEMDTRRWSPARAVGLHTSPWDEPEDFENYNEQIRKERVSF